MPRRNNTGWAAALGCAALALAAGCTPAPPADTPGPGAATAADSVAPDGVEDADTMVRAASASRTGRVATARDLRDARVVRAEQLLEGRFAGVQVTRLAGGGISVRIRGGTSIMGDNEPLYVLDGMPLQAGPGGALNGINPEDIARIEMLKDIGSTAIYGIRGANGVVLITTKRY
ncbi:MAG: TonB-dependent receptor plug domain-containing protein [Gemmatimonadetes bacterium]|nr:TonB-dependent receptor plug domain-containing protein [Gemmatimonadota bacterium]